MSGGARRAFAAVFLACGVGLLASYVRDGWVWALLFGIAYLAVGLWLALATLAPRRVRITVNLVQAARDDRQPPSWTH
ncbi:MAG: hypothetical protein K2X87_09365 [Gemmataceae bacterium]|nr:hypothetical protein [Gemmataceae bacterium]